MAEETKEELEKIKEAKKSQETAENSETVKTTEASEKAKESKEFEEYVDLAWKKSIEKYVLGSEVSLCAILGKTIITLEDLLNLEEGDVIVLDKKVEEPVEIYIEGIPKMLGKLGVFKNRMAVQVQKFLTLEEEENIKKEES